MIRKHNRFQGPNSTRRLVRHGKNARLGPLSLRHMPGSVATRVAIVVSKKVDKRAVVRNRIRRRVFEIMRHQLPLIAQPTDLTIGVFDSRVATLPHQELEDLVVEVLKRAKLYS